MGEGDCDRCRFVSPGEEPYEESCVRAAALWGLSNRDIQDREFAEEIETHLQMHIEDNLRFRYGARAGASRGDP